MQHFIDQAILEGLISGHIPIPFGLAGDFFHRLAGMPGENFVDHRLGLKDLLGLDFDIGGLPADAPPGLVQHDLGVGQGVPFTFRARRQDDGRSGLGPADTIRRYRRANETHCVIDRHRVVHAAARGIDVQTDFTVTLQIIKVQHLHDNLRRSLIRNFPDQKHDAVLQQHIIEAHLAIALILAVLVIDIHFSRLHLRVHREGVSLRQFWW